MPELSKTNLYEDTNYGTIPIIIPSCISLTNGATYPYNNYIYSNTNVVTTAINPFLNQVEENIYNYINITENINF